jgi:Bacterial aa3 type cytochrome c oxidase subunit IV
MSIDTSRGHDAMDYNEHKRTYAGFIRMTQIAVVFLVALLTAMYVFLV